MDCRFSYFREGTSILSLNGTPMSTLMSSCPPMPLTSTSMTNTNSMPLLDFAKYNDGFGLSFSYFLIVCSISSVRIKFLKWIPNAKVWSPLIGLVCRILMSCIDLKSIFTSACRKKGFMIGNSSMQMFETLIALTSAHASLGLRKKTEIEDSLIAILLVENSLVCSLNSPHHHWPLVSQLCTCGQSLLPFHSKKFLTVYESMNDFYTMLKTTILPLQSVIKID